MANVIERKTFQEKWEEAGHAGPHPVIGSALAEFLGRPDLAEQPFITRASVGEVKASEEGPLDLDVVISTSREDRTRDTIRNAPENWILDTYAQLPVVLLGHQYDNPAKNIIGKNAELGFDTLEEEGGTIQRMVGKDILIPDEVGRRLHGITRFIGSIGVSIGFRPEEVEPRKRTSGKASDRPLGLDFITSEKLEHSIVTIPCNREGMARVAAKGLLVNSLLPLFSISPDQSPDATPAISGPGPADLKALGMALDVAGLRMELSHLSGRVKGN